MRYIGGDIVTAEEEEVKDQNESSCGSDDGHESPPSKIEDGHCVEKAVTPQIKGQVTVGCGR